MEPGSVPIGNELIDLAQIQRRSVALISGADDELPSRSQAARFAFYGPVFQSKEKCVRTLAVLEAGAEITTDVVGMIGSSTCKCGISNSFL